tara:strand:- start:2210 stop:2698 length:489 start_codon:yes stop_codon:yes gene_type:complete
MKNEKTISLKELIKLKEKEMKVNELRIGNIVSHEDYSNELFEVIGIELEDEGYVINTKGGKNGTWINSISLITKVPITKELLLKLGFWYNETMNVYQWGGYLQFGFNIEGLEFNYYTLDFSKSWITTQVKYIHELQNLCFELEKEQELKLIEVSSERSDLPY